ncbi:MAG TPA: tripartite tricarboxylate transporter substrate binding protein [Bordetella sp.]|uniref:Bug family tripartite tricarboxylate transporter substrate binding protein n=1 Tax=Bordetella sp. TaxID=28081 RepID=UPI002ED1ACB7
MRQYAHTLARLARTLGIGTGLALTCVLAAHATGTYPEKPINIVVPYAPGGALDTVTRVVAVKMGEVLKQSIIVDNRPGAATNIGMDYVARQPADGYTILTASPSLTVNGALFSKLPFNPSKAFAPIGEIGYAPQVIVVPANSPYKTLEDLIGDAKKHPDKLSFGTPGIGSSGHLAVALLESEGKFQATHIPYKGGEPAMNDLLGGRLSFMAINPLEALAHLKAGTLRALVVLSDKPMALLPGVPDVVQAGLPGAQVSVWWGFVGPAGMPKPVIDKLNAALQAALKDPAVQTRLANLGAILAPGTADDLGKFIAAQTAKWGEVIKTAGIQAN